MNKPKKNVLVTGGTSGVGKAIAIGVAKTGAQLILVGRNSHNGEKTVQEIIRISGNPDITFLEADLSLIQSVYRLSETLKKRYDHLDCLVNAAGAWYFKKEQTREGIDRSFAVNYLGHFALTTGLLDLLKQSEEARIITVGGSPRFMKNPRINPENLAIMEAQNGLKAISSAMYARIYFGYELADRLKDTSVSSIIFHPGFVKSNIGRNVPWWLKFLFLFSSSVRNAPETCESGVFVSTMANPGAANGSFIDDQKKKLDLRANFDKLTGKKLWESSTELIQQVISKQANTASLKAEEIL